METPNQQGRRAVLALVASVFLLPMVAIGIILALGIFEGSVAFEVLNKSGARIRDVRLEVGGERMELGAFDFDELRRLEGRLPAQVEIRVHDRLEGQSLWRSGPLFKLDAGMEDRVFRIVLRDDKVWRLTQGE